jgi:hypothetical protein
MIARPVVSRRSKVLAWVSALLALGLDTSHASFATRPTQALELITNAAAAV